MEESILRTIKPMVNVEPDYDAYDIQIITHINRALATLTQLGVGPKEGFRITGDAEKWDDFVQGRTDLESVKEYIHIRVWIVFDPPANATVMQALKEDAAELEFRLNIQVD